MSFAVVPLGVHPDRSVGPSTPSSPGLGGGHASVSAAELKQRLLYQQRMQEGHVSANPTARFKRRRQSSSRAGSPSSHPTQRHRRDSQHHQLHLHTGMYAATGGVPPNAVGYERLPDVLMGYIASLLTYGELLRMAQVSRRWRNVVLARAHLWEEIRIPVLMSPRLTDRALATLLNRCNNKPTILDLRGCSRLTGTCLRPVRACMSLAHVDIRGTQLLGDVPGLLSSLSPIETVAATRRTAKLKFKHVDTRLVVQAPWHGVVRNVAEWNKVVEAIGQHAVSAAASGHPNQSILPPVDFNHSMLLIVSISGHFNETFWPKPLQRIKDITDMGSNLAVCVKMMRTENAGWMSMASVPQSAKPVSWYFDQQEDWADAAQTFKLEPSQAVGARQSEKSPSTLVIEEKHPAKQLDMYLELLVDSGLVRKFGRSVRQLTRNLEDGRFSIQQLIRESPIHLPGHLGLTLLRESAYRALPKVAQRVVAPATASRETPPASPGRGSRGGDPNAGGGGGGGSGGGGGADGVGSSGVSGGVNGAAAEKPRTGPRTKVGRKPHAAWLLGECDTPPHTRHGSPVFFGRGDRGGSSSDDGIATGGSDYTDSDSESDGGGSHGSGGGGGAVREVAPSTLGGDSGLGDGQDSGVHPMEQGHDTPVFFPADKAGGGGSAAAAAAAGAGAGAGAGTTANVINDAGSSGSGGSSNRSRRRRRRNCGRSRRDDAESVGGILEEVSRVLAEEQGLSASTFPPIESLRLRVVKKEDGDGGEGEDSDTARATPAPAHGRGKGAARAIKMEGEGGKSADGGTTASTTASTARAALSVARVLLGNAAVAGAAAAPPIKSEAASAAGNNAAPADSGGKRRAASVEMKMKQFSDWAGKPWASLPMNGELERYMEQLYAQPSHDVNAVLAYPSWYFREYELCFPEHHRAMLTAAAAQRASATANALALGKPVYNASTGQWSGPTVATAANVAAAAAAAAAAAVHKPPPQSLTAHTAAHAAKQLQPQPSAAADAIMDGVDAVGSDVDTSDHGSVDSSVSDKSNEEAVAIPVRQPRTAASAKAAAAARKAAAAALKVEREKAEAAAKATAAKEAEAAAVAAREAAAREPPLSPCSLHLPSGGVVPGSQKPPVPTTLDEARRIAADAAREAAEAAAAAAAADPAEAAAAKARGCPSGCTCPASMLAMQQRHATLVPNKLRSAAPTSYASTAYYPQGYGLPSQKGFTAAQNGGGGGGGWMRNTAKSPAPRPTTRSYQFFHTDTSTVAIIGSDLNCCKEGCEHEHGAQ